MKTYKHYDDFDESQPWPKMPICPKYLILLQERLVGLPELRTGKARVNYVLREFLQDSDKSPQDDPGCNK